MPSALIVVSVVESCITLISLTFALTGAVNVNVADISPSFSTKIADSLATGVGFLLYAPPEVACSKYLKDNEAAFVVNNKDELFITLKNLAENPDDCRRYSKAARELAEKNHNFKNNAIKFQNVLKSAVLQNK